MNLFFILGEKSKKKLKFLRKNWNKKAENLLSRIRKPEIEKELKIFSSNAEVIRARKSFRFQRNSNFHILRVNFMFTICG